MSPTTRRVLETEHRGLVATASEAGIRSSELITTRARHQRMMSGQTQKGAFYPFRGWKDACRSPRGSRHYVRSFCRPLAVPITEPCLRDRWSGGWGLSLTPGRTMVARYDRAHRVITAAFT